MIQTLRMDSCGVLDDKTVTLKTGGKQRGRSLKGIARLVAMHAASVREATTPHVWVCEDHMKSGAASAVKQGAVVPLFVSKDQYLLLWGAGGRGLGGRGDRRGLLHHTLGERVHALGEALRTRAGCDVRYAADRRRLVARRCNAKAVEGDGEEM